MRQPWWILALAVALAPAAHADELAVPSVPGDAQPAETQRTDPVVITATKSETPARELGASVSVVTEEDFRTYHFPTVDEALRPLPGVQIRRSGTLGKTSTIGIRGANPNQVQVLVDGVRVKSPTLGQAELSDLAPELIERIEIIRGPQSALYGADAIGGVVNVITRRGKGPFTASLSQEAGFYDTLISRGSLSGSVGPLDYAAGALHEESNGHFQNDGMDQNAFNAQVGLSLPGESRIGAIVRWNKTDSGLPVKFVCCGPLPIQPFIDHNAEQQSETLIVSLDGRTRPVPWWESRARVSRYENSLGFQDPVDIGYAFDLPCDSQINVERREAEWVNAFHVGRVSTSTVGLEYRHEEGSNRSVCFGAESRFRARSHVYAAFFEQQVRILERLFLSGGVRIEDHSVFGTVITERGGFSWLVGPWGTRLHGSAGTGFRAPTLNDLFFPGFSNVSLQPERSLSWDVGVEQRFWQDRVRAGATFFHTKFQDLIRFLPISTPPFVEVVNVARARAEGVEMTLEVDLLRSLTASVNYTYTDTEDLAADRPLPREPRHRWNVGLVWEPIRALTLWAQVHTWSRQFESEAAGYNSGHTRVDLGGTWRLWERAGWRPALEATLRVQNLLDEAYSEVRGFPALGRMVLAGLRARY